MATVKKTGARGSAKKTSTSRAATKKTATRKTTVKKTAVKKASAKKSAAPRRTARTQSMVDKFAFPLSFEDELRIPPISPRISSNPPMTGKVIPPSYIGKLESAQYTKSIQGTKPNKSRDKKIGLIAAFIATAVISSGATYFIQKPAPVQFSDQTSFQAKISGGVVLTEVELKAAVKKLGVTVFWAGSMKDAKYTLNASDLKQIYVRYLPGGRGVGDTKKKYRVIATYIVPGAFAATAAAGNQSNGVTLSRTDGAVVYYNKLEPTNVYLAEKDSNYQVEVFDPDAPTSLQLATTLKTVIPII